MKAFHYNGHLLSYNDCVDKLLEFEGYNEEQGILQFAGMYLNDRTHVEVSTSGTTGEPKRMQLLKEHMRNSALMTGKYFGLETGMSALLCLPIQYIAGKMMVVRAIELGLELTAIDPGSSPLSDTDQSFDFSAMVPLQVENSIAEPETRDRFQQIAQVIIGGGAVSPQLHDRLQPLTNRCYATYGMTETITHVAVQVLNGPDARPDYQALPGVKVWQDERECLTITAPHLNPEKLITNDVVELTDFDRFRWLGRADNVINSGGVKIHPEKVEAKLARLLDRPYFLIGEADEKLGERVVLVLEGDALDERTERLLMETLRDELDRFEVPKAIHYVEQFKRTESGKIKRSATYF